MKPIVDDFRFRERNRLQGGSDVRRAHVHGDCFHGSDLSPRKLGKTSFGTLHIISFRDGLHRAAIQIHDQRQIALALGKGLLIDAQMWDRAFLFSRLASRHGPFHDLPGLIPSCPQDFHGAGHRLRRQHNVNREPLEQSREATILLCPGNRNIPYAMLRALYTRSLRRQNRFELTGIQMAPATLLGVVVARQLKLAIRTAKLGAARMLHRNDDLLRLDV
jgi:hypothetical protein